MATAIRKKILIVCDSSKSLLDFRGKLMEKMQINHQVYVFTPKITQKSISDRLHQMGVEIYESSLNGSNVAILSDLVFMVSLFKLLKAIKPDVFFPYTLKPVIYGTVLAKICKVKLIVPMLTGLGYNFTDGNHGNKIVIGLTKLLLKLSLKPRSQLNIVFQNKDDAQKLITLGILGPKHHIHVVNGSGVDLNHYTYTKPSLRKITFLMISRLINAKGLNEYYEAAKAMHLKYPLIRFKLIGAHDKNIDGLKKGLYQQLLSGNPIQYLGQLDDVRPAIKEASVVVLPSYYGEGVPRSILESMAMGRAVITCDSVGCRETVNQQAGKENGFLVPIKDSVALASKMEYFILNKNKIINYGYKGLAFAKEKFDVNLINNDLFRIMQLEA